MGGLFSVVSSASTNAVFGVSEHYANASIENAYHKFNKVNKKIKNHFYGHDYHDYDNNNNNSNEWGI